LANDSVDAASATFATAAGFQSLDSANDSVDVDAASAAVATAVGFPPVTLLGYNKA
jgi:hypothetical protein